MWPGHRAFCNHSRCLNGRNLLIDLHFFLLMLANICLKSRQRVVCARQGKKSNCQQSKANKFKYWCTFCAKLNRESLINVASVSRIDVWKKRNVIRKKKILLGLRLNPIIHANIMHVIHDLNNPLFGLF